MEEGFREKELFKITIDDFSEYIVKANKARPIPYIKGKKPLPKKYSDNEEYEWRKIKYWGKIIEARFKKDADMKDFLISNSKTANKPRLVKVNGNEVYNQTGGSFNRAFMRNILHKYFDKYLEGIEPIKDVEVYPLYIWIKFYIHDMGKGNIDNDNKWPWRKFFQDSLAELGIIPDDNVYLVNDNRETTYLIPPDQKQKMEIVVYGREKVEEAIVNDVED